MPNTYRGTSAARTRTPYTPPHRVSISADNTPAKVDNTPTKLDNRVEYKPPENNHNDNNKTPIKNKARRSNSNTEATPIKTPSKIIPLSIPSSSSPISLSPAPSFTSSSSYSYSTKSSPAIEHIQANTNMKVHSYSPKHAERRPFPSPPRIHSKPPISPSSHFPPSNSNNVNLNFDDTEPPILPKSRSKKNLRVPMPFASSPSNHELNNESLYLRFIIYIFYIFYYFFYFYKTKRLIKIYTYIIVQRIGLVFSSSFPICLSYEKQTHISSFFKKKQVYNHDSIYLLFLS